MSASTAACSVAMSRNEGSPAFMPVKKTQPLALLSDEDDGEMTGAPAAVALITVLLAALLAIGWWIL